MAELQTVLRIKKDMRIYIPKALIEASGAKEGDLLTVKISKFEEE